MENRNPDSTELSQFMEETQALALKNSALNDEFADGLEGCREECTSKLEALFAKDFEILMTDPVETLKLNLKAKVNPALEIAEQEEHDLKKNEIKKTIEQMQVDYERSDQKRLKAVNFINDHLLKI